MTLTYSSLRRVLVLLALSFLLYKPAKFASRLVHVSPPLGFGLLILPEDGFVDLRVGEPSELAVVHVPAIAAGRGAVSV